MIFLPIVERELRVAARKRSTFWVRISAALVALVVGSGFLILHGFAGFVFGTGSLGSGLFGVLTWLCLAVALSAGLFFTADCLSEEKREGTLGFLFLTDLRGYDVVFGKLLATSLRSVDALLAVFPILAITLLLGGVTGLVFWKTLLALVNAMFVSLAAGMFVSAISRDSQKALAGTLLLLLLWVLAGPVVDGTIAGIRQRAFNPLLSLASPGYLFTEADAWGKSWFWPTLLVNQVAAWAFFGLTCYLIPRTWRERTSKSSTPKGDWVRRWRFGGDRRRAALRRQLVDVNPALWLACRERWQAVLLWVLTILLLGAMSAIIWSGARSAWWMIWGYLGGLFTFVLYLGMASQAGRFFVEARRSGLLELLLATPLTARQMVQGQWRGLVRMFGLPLALCLAAQVLGSVLYYQTLSRFAASIPAATATNALAATNAVVVTTTTTAVAGGTVTVAGSYEPNPLVTLSIAIAGALAVAGNLVAIIWFGMWMGLNSKNTGLATLRTIGYVQAIPWLVVSFASMIITPLLLMPWVLGGAANAPSQFMVWYPMLISLVATVLVLVKDLVFVLWARQKLYSELRERASRAGAPARVAQPLPSPHMPVPPVIPPVPV